MTETRCDWCGSLPIYINYHDEEWGVPEYDSRALWEKLVLDGFQAGLSWLTILKKRDAFRAAFANFDPEKVARFDEADIQRLLGDAGIVRHRGKIEAAITGAQAWLKLQDGPGFAPMMWGYVDGQPLVNRFQTMAEVPASSDLSLKISKDLKKLGFKFCGPTIVYAWMEATGLINDHLVTCHRHEAVKTLAR
ncbi:DNA-3-methyladenine glycosylase I [Neptunicoccus sediminis]|uniref:DNA-3-methyladenine glycosylase I n=1 Tax=Neptunicoccus sediminis TaxID=1892596 RepID=UPI0008460166|nr:DNA-3-methyladenine glycosylase I [Neptunicoccus sediminis]